MQVAARRICSAPPSDPVRPASRPRGERQFEQRAERIGVQRLRWNRAGPVHRPASGSLTGIGITPRATAARRRPCGCRNGSAARAPVQRLQAGGVALNRCLLRARDGRCTTPRASATAAEGATCGSSGMAAAYPSGMYALRMRRVRHPDKTAEDHADGVLPACTDIRQSRRGVRFRQSRARCQSAKPRITRRLCVDFFSSS